MARADVRLDSAKVARERAMAQYSRDLEICERSLELLAISRNLLKQPIHKPHPLD